MIKNKSTGNMYDGVNTFNPLAGECPHHCAYCSTRKFMRYPQFKEKYSGELRLHKPAFKPLGKGKTIFVVAQNDLFADGVRFDWIDEIFLHCFKYPENKYMIQTKNTLNLLEWYQKTHLEIPDNFIFGTTLETNYTGNKFTGGLEPYQRVSYLSRIKHQKFITIEPIMDFFSIEIMVDFCKMVCPVIIYIGANTSKVKLREPAKEDILLLISELEKFTKVEQKSNLKRLLK